MIAPTHCKGSSDRRRGEGTNFRPGRVEILYGEGKLTPLYGKYAKKWLHINFKTFFSVNMPQKNPFRGGTFETEGFNICPTSKNVNTPFKYPKILPLILFNLEDSAKSVNPRYDKSLVLSAMTKNTNILDYSILSDMELVKRLSLLICKIIIEESWLQ